MSDNNLTDSTNTTIKGQENKDETSKNQYFNKINIPARETELDNIQFRPSKPEKDWNIKFQITPSFKIQERFIY